MSNMKRVYVDGVFDMFHMGHLQSFRKCRALVDDPWLVVGIVTDEDAASYKRLPIISHKHRVELIGALREVDEIIENPPLVVDENFIQQHRIDLVAHGFKDELDFQRQKEFFKVPIALGKFKTIAYSDEISTTEIIHRVSRGCKPGTQSPWSTSAWDAIDVDDTTLTLERLEIKDQPMDVDEIKEVLDTYENILKQRTHLHVGYPYNLSESENTTMVLPFLRFSVNNLGDPFISSNYAVHSRYFEQAVLDFFAKLWELPSRNDYWGYMTACGTECNLHAIHIGRERIPSATLCASAESHYSVFKAAHLYRMNSDVVKTQPSGEMNYDDLEVVLRKNCDAGVVLSVNIGTTVKGAVDRIGRIVEVVKKVGLGKDKIHIHCDGALVGVMLPHIMPASEDTLTFNNPYIDSISVSGHKMLGCPMPCGVLITRRPHIQSLMQRIEYLNSLDTTHMGSRNGHSAIFVWHSLVKKGMLGVCEEAKKCVESAKYMCELCTANGISATINAYSCTVVLPRPSETFVQRWQLACDDTICHVVVMPNVTTEKIDRFITEYFHDLGCA